MKAKIKITKELISDNNKLFRVGEDIAFTIYNKNYNYHDRYICRIEDIEDNFIFVNNVEINRCKVDGQMKIRLDDIESNSCNYVYVD